MRNAICILFVLAAVPCGARTITVDNDGPADFATIQAAIDDANDGDTVEIQPGTYTGPGNVGIVIEGKSITVTSVDPNDPNVVGATIIDCEGAGRGLYIHDASPTVAGLKVINGDDFYAGGIICRGGGPVIINCVLTANNVAIHCEASTSQEQGAKILKCTIVGNSGAGILYEYMRAEPGWVVTIADCNISGNSGVGVSTRYATITNSTINNNAGSGVSGASSVLNCTVTGNAGGGVSWASSVLNCTVTGNGGPGLYGCSGEILNCIVTNNSGYGIGESFGTISNCTITGNGGGIIGWVSRTDITTRISNCVISDNISSGEGGGIYFQSQSLEIVNCKITNNHAGYPSWGQGGGMFLADCTAIIANCIISGNQTYDYDGGGIFFYRGSLDIVNCTIAENGTYGIYNSGGATLTNCILWGNMRSPFEIRGDGWVVASWSAVQGGYAGEGNIDADPRLTSDYYLTSNSPCIDAGTPEYEWSAYESDIDGEERIFKSRVDIGADEFIDIDGDGLPDRWEVEHFNSATAGEPGGNPDKDSWPNIREYTQGTSPVELSDYYVDPVDGNDLWDGVSRHWDGQHGPKSTIQAAIDSCDAGQVILLPGTFTGDGNRDISLRGKPIIVRSLDPDDPSIVASTIIDAQGSATEGHRGFHLNANEGIYSAIDGLTITGGAIENSSGGPDSRSGGGIMAFYTRTTIARCNIVGNRADTSGGGVYGRFNKVVDCVIANNSASTGGGISMVFGAVVNCTIINNAADHAGGGLGVGYFASVSDCTIANNIAPRGGGIWCYFYSGSSTINNCLITDNTASRGGGIYVDRLGTFIASNCTIANNSAGSGGGVYLDGETPRLVNSIVWGNSPNQLQEDPGNSVSITCSNVQDSWPGEGNIDADPCFFNPINADYHLKSQAGRWDPNEGGWTMDDLTSPCVDAGNPISAIGREPFGNGGIINMGAYGGTGEASKSYFGKPPCETIVAGDIDGNCVIDFRDFRLMALHWGDDFSP